MSTQEYPADGQAKPRKFNRVSVRWAGDRRYDVEREGAPIAHLDGRGVAGPGPVDTLLGALAACTSIDVVDILEKRRTPLESLEVEVVGDRALAVPARLTHIRLRYVMRGAGVERAHAERAVELSITKYCSVRDSLDPALPIEWEIELNGE